MSQLQISVSNTIRPGMLRSGFVRQTHNFLPGPVIRGALASAWLAGRRFDDLDAVERELFVELFEGGVRFGPAYFGSAPLGVSVLQHKYGPLHSCKRPSWDRAFLSEVDVPVECPDCRQPLVEAKGEIDDEGISKGRQTRTRMRNGLVDVEDGALFADEYLRPRSLLARGQIFGRPDLLQKIVDIQGVRMGGSLSTKGAVAVEISDQSHRLAAVSKTIVVRMVSPALFVDNDGFASRAPDLNQLSKIVGVAASDIEIEESWTRWVKIGGWHAASALPKNEELAICAGSTFRIKFAQNLTPEQVDALVQHGIGLRRHEGFGHLDVLERPSALWGFRGRLADHSELSQWAPRVVAILEKVAKDERRSADLLRAFIEMIQTDFPEEAHALRALSGASAHRIHNAITEVGSK